MVSDGLAWLTSPASGPGGALAVEKRGALGPFDVVPGQLVARKSGVHRFTVSGTAGVSLQARVATDSFVPVVVLIAPGGVRWDLSHRVRAPDAGTGSAGAEDLILPEPGDYTLLVSSRENVDALAAATTGEYRLTLLCDAPVKVTPSIPRPPPSSRSGRFGAWESEPR